MLSNHRYLHSFLAPAIIFALAASPALAQRVTPPDEHLGRPVGRDFELADWREVSTYFRRLGEESPRAVTERLGATTEGRDFLMTVISSEENLAQLDRWRRYARMIADPRGRSDEELHEAVEEGKVILLISPAMHSTEIAGTQWAMEFAHQLITSDAEPWRSARENLIVGIFACTNPDGLDHVVEWYRETVGTPYEAAGMLRLYQYYAGHDNNRDWFMLTQAETRIVTEQLYSVWFPQVYWDVHQQAANRERFFVPPFRDPLNPNLDPAIVTGIGLLGGRALHDMTREGLTGISTGVSYDMWWTGGNRNVPVRHNIMGLLTEAASARLATPIFLPRSDLAAPRGLDGYHPSNQFPAPWPGGWWRIRDIIDYQHAFGRSLLGSLSREREFWLRNALEASQRTIERGRTTGPRGWLIPSDNRDPAAARRLVDVLIRSGVEVHVATESVLADGRTYPPGTIVIHRDQPYSAHVKDLFEVQRYPDGPPPYDVAGWTLPLLVGVRRVEVMEPIVVNARLVGDADEATAAFRGDERLRDEPNALSSWQTDTWRRLIRRLREGEAFTFIHGGRRSGIFLPGEAEPGVAERRILVRSMPRIGLYAPWEGDMDEGWMRFMLDTNEVPYLRVRNEMLRAGRLNDFLDVLIITSRTAGRLDRGRPEGTIHDEFAGGLAPEGAVAVEEFVRTGGTLITIDASSAWAIDLLGLPLTETTSGPEARDFSCPGSVLRTVPEPHALTAGLPESVAVFFSRSRAWRITTDREQRDAHPPRSATTLLRYAPTRVLLSGWINQPSAVEGRSAWVRATYGEGRVHLFAFRPHYRGWSQGTWQLIFRAMLLEE